MAASICPGGLRRWHYSEEQLRHHEMNEPFRALMQFEVERARSYYEAARPWPVCSIGQGEPCS